VVGGSSQDELTMHRRSTLEIGLGGLFGALLGGIITVSLLFTGIGHWLVWLPIPAGALAGIWKGDRGLRGLIRMLKLTP